jgi:hypothetical protein
MNLSARAWIGDAGHLFTDPSGLEQPLGAAFAEEERHRQEGSPYELQADDAVMVTMRGAKMLFIRGRLGSQDARWPVAEFPIESGEQSITAMLGVQVTANRLGAICVAEERFVHRATGSEFEESMGIWTNPLGCSGRVRYSDRSGTGMMLHIGDPVAGHEGVNRFEQTSFMFRPDGSSRFRDPGSSSQLLGSLMFGFVDEEDEEDDTVDITGSSDGVDVRGVGGPDAGGAAFRVRFVLPLAIRRQLAEQEAAAAADPTTGAPEEQG